MWDTVRQWLHTLPVREEVVESVLMVMALLVFRGVLLKLYLRRHPHYSIEEKRRSLVLSRNLTLILTIFGLAVIWATQIQTLALSMFAVAAAIVVATKELIMCLSGSILRSVTKQYSVGDYIEVNGLRGRVVDINLLNTLMMQIGPNPLVGQLSGKTLSFPNSLLLNHSVRRDNILGDYPKSSGFRAIILAFILSLTYESIQYVLTIGFPDVTDLIDNTLGAILGVIIINIISVIFREKLRIYMNVILILFSGYIIHDILYLII